MADDTPPPPGWLTYKWAVLVAKYRVMPGELAGLTDVQMDELLLHPRDKDGALKEPKAPEKPAAPPTRESRLASIAQLEAMGLITPQRAAELREEVDRNGDAEG